MTVEIFSPNTKNVKSYGLGETVNVSINSSAIIPILADKIYKDPLSAIRELFANEVTACKKSMELDKNAKPRIEIRFNTDNRELSIKGIDSLGIDSETFNQILAVMGNSGNNKGDQSGYFGLGFYSYVKLSERCILISNSRVSKEKYAYIGKSSISFEKMPIGTYEDLEQYGFNIILTVKDEIEDHHITNKISDLVLLCPIPVSYYINDELYPLKQFTTLLEYFKDRFTEYFNDDYPDYSLIYNHIDNENYEMISGNMYNKLKAIREVRLVNMPIKINERALNRYYTNGDFFIINLKNEREFKPKPDREDLEMDSEKRVIDIINSHEITEEFLESKQKKYQNIDEWFCDKDKFYQRVEIIREYGKSIYDDNRYGRVKSQSRSIRSHIELWGYNIKPEKYLVSKTLRRNIFEQLKDHNVFCVCVKGDTYDKLLKFGFQSLNEYLGKSDTKINRDIKTTKFVYHYAYGTTYNEPKDNTKYIFKTPNVINDRGLLRDNNSKICMITDKATLEDNRVYTLEQIPKILKDVVFVTNYGLYTIKEILKLRKNTFIDFQVLDDGTFIQEYFMRDKIASGYSSRCKKFAILTGFYNMSDEIELLELYLNLKGWTNIHHNSHNNFYYDKLYSMSDSDNDMKTIIEVISSYKINKKLYESIMRLKNGNT